jgi:Asp-tRNA(Asn)/Glu-tRNA(Gln) amidotransferase A subunit family amidase
VESGLPIGIQVIAAPWREDLCFHVTRTLMRLGAVVERALPLDNP